MKILVMGQGAVELAFDGSWTVEADPSGHLTLTDPTDECKLEISYLRLPPGLRAPPPVESFLAHTLAEGNHHPEAGVIVDERTDLRLAWADYEFISRDTNRDEVRRPAHGRWALAANTRFQTLTTFYYWADDADWAVPAWERLIKSLTLGDGIPLTDLSDHWALREPN